MKIRLLAIGLGLIALIIGCQQELPKADLVITNAIIWTGDENQPMAQSMAISGDTIMAVGSTGQITHLIGDDTEVVEAEGAFITPGFIDSHLHLMGGGNSLLSIDLRYADTPEAFSRRIGEYAKTLEPGEWILEGNWDHTLWGGELPKKEWIDALTPDNPVAITRLDGHMLLANSLALKIAGIDASTPDVEGGDIIRDERGEPTGILKDNAMDPIWPHVPSNSDAGGKAAFDAAQHYLVSNGVTSVHDMNGLDGKQGTYHYATTARDNGELKLRIYAVKGIRGWKQLADMVAQEGVGDKWLRIGSLKGFVDGSLGSHTALFKDPYTDQPDDHGLMVNSEEDLYTWISGADKAGLHILIHGIGDRGIRTILDIYDRVAEENGPRDRRHRIEHAQHMGADDFDLFKATGTIAAAQPYHCIDDGRWAKPLIGAERIKTTYPFKTFEEKGIPMAFGSDWPVAPATPLEGIYAAVTRRTLDDKNPEGWVPEQKISVETALAGYTRDAAYASFEEDIKGTLEPGKLADFVIISADLTKVDPVTIRDLEILKTYVGGKKVYDHSETE
ncbi:MAG: amidohydrolase [Candidatus Marinimicrobia bacterium]|nr:amidohydrolase [Candidatus Neomarinimicrobiota bacterium]MCF7850198.1 amidohydrolase [Candidatus Neomarinimicrobiota bacterium]MCF7903760.1 amidohydrolase [Candidatus Neomarinimicrobiota bacterium]